MQPDNNSSAPEDSAPETFEDFFSDSPENKPPELPDRTPPLSVIQTLKLISGHILIALVLFFIGAGFGTAYPETIKPILEPLMELVQKSIGKGWVAISLMIFVNNIKAAFSAILLGPAFSVVPILQAFANGSILGYVFTSIKVDVPFDQLFMSIVPHGIFELPAIFISWGLGIWLGTWPFNKTHKFKVMFSASLRVLIRVIIPLLIVAAMIEGALITLSR